jgi:hypothetical protein
MELAPATEGFFGKVVQIRRSVSQETGQMPIWA